MRGRARRRWCGLVLGGAWWLAACVACNKTGGATEGPAMEAGADAASAGVPVAQRTPPPPQDEPGVIREGCPEGMVRIEGNDTLQPFCMGQTEVSVREFRRCVEAKKCRAFDLRWDFDDPKKATWLLGDESMPINYVGEEQARQYCAFVGGRLPTGEEWIWAQGSARGWAFPWGNEFSDERDRYCGCWQRPGQRFGQTVLCPAKQYPEDRTLQGVYDMAGSANEIIGPNEEGEYGIPLVVAPKGIRASETSADGYTQVTPPQAWYAGPLVTWSHKTTIRCAAQPG
jgi:hypothetical protein